MASSIEFVPVDVDMLDDPKVSALMDDLGGGDPSGEFAAYGRLMAILVHVYHDGFYMRYGKFERRKLAKDVGLSPEELDSFIGACIECEIFDAGMFERGVLTSKGIQRRYFKAKKLGKQSIAPDEEEYIIDDDGCQRGGAADRSENRRESPRSSENRRKVPKSSEIRREAPRIAEPSEEKISKEKISKEEDEDEARAPARRGSSSSDSNDRANQPPQPYPLACLSTVYDEHGAYFDDAGEAFETPWDALVSTYANRTRGQPIEGFARQVAAMCPRGCDRSLERVEECARLFQRAVAGYDPGKSPTPFPLAKKIIEDERGAP